MEAKKIEQDVGEPLFGQPTEYILNQPFDANGLAVLYRNVGIKPQVGREVSIRGGGRAIIKSVEQDPRGGFNITLEKK